MAQDNQVSSMAVWGKGIRAWVSQVRYSDHYTPPRKVRQKSYDNGSIPALTWKRFLQEVSFDGLVGCSQVVGCDDGVVAVVVVGGVVEEQAAVRHLPLLVEFCADKHRLPEKLTVEQPVDLGWRISVHEKLNAVLHVADRLQYVDDAWRI